MSSHTATTTGQPRARRGRPLALLGALALTAALVAPLAPPAGATHDPGEAHEITIDRFDGDDRHDTACKIAQDGFGTSDTVILARADAFPDSLSGNYLAGQLGVPVLLVAGPGHPEPDEVDDVTAQCLDDLEAQDVILLGGTDAISQAVADELDEEYDVERIGGEDRHETAALVAERGEQEGQVGEVTTDDGDGRTAIIARADEFPDALVSGGAAYDGDFPVLLTPPGFLDEHTDQALDDLDIDHALISGGEEAILPTVEAQIQDKDITTERVAGLDRTETATEWGDWVVDHLDWERETINLALGADFPDALVMGPHAGAQNAGMLLAHDTDELDSPGGFTSDWLDEHAEAILAMHIAGGTAAISADVEAEARAAAETEEPEPGETDAPELTGASVVAFDDAEDELTVRFTFDETVDTDVSEPDFGISLYDGTHVDEATADTERDAEDDTSVLAVFDLDGEEADQLGDGFALDQELATDLFTVAWVDTGAVIDDDGNDSPEGAVGLESVAHDAGETLGPNLLEVGAFSGDEASFAFSEDIDTAPADQGDLVLVEQDGTLFESDAGTCELEAGDEHVVTCEFDGFDAATDTIVRGYVLDSVVTGADTGLDNAPQADAVALDGQTDDHPNLVDIDVNRDEGWIDYTFDVDIDDGAGDYFVYDAAGEAYEGTFDALDNDGTTARVDFDPVDLAIAIGTFIADDAVEDDDTGEPSRADERGVALSFEAGEMIGPQLVSVTVDWDEDEVVFTFDRDLESDLTVEVALYEEDGTRNSETCSTDDDTVTCDITGPGLFPGQFSEDEAQAAALGGIPATEVAWEGVGNHADSAAAEPEGDPPNDDE